MRVRDALKMLSPRSGGGMDSDTPLKFNNEFTPEKMVVGRLLYTTFLLGLDNFSGVNSLLNFGRVFFFFWGGGQVKLEEQITKSQERWSL